MDDLEKLYILKYIDRKHDQFESNIVEIKNRLIVRRSRPEDYVDLALELARQEGAFEILRDLTKILRNFRY